MTRSGTRTCSEGKSSRLSSSSKVTRKYSTTSYPWSLVSSKVLEGIKVSEGRIRTEWVVLRNYFHHKTSMFFMYNLFIFLFPVIIKAVLSVITSSGACWAPRCPPSAWSRPPRAPAASAWTCPGCGPQAAPPPPPGVCTISVEYRDTTSVLTLTCNSLRFPPVSPPSYWAEQFVSRPPPWHSPAQLFPCDNIRSGGRGIHSVIFPRGVVHRVENGWGLTKVAVVLLNGLIW